MERYTEKVAGEKLPEYPMEELVMLVAELAEKFTGRESSSITYEKAQQLMEAVTYCIRECGEWEEYDVTEGPDSEACDGTVRKMWEKPQGAREAYELGHQIVLRKTARFRDVYHGILQRFDSYGNRCLEETFTRGLPEFLRWYDARFAPQETILTLDYPVLSDLSEVTGIDAVLKYGTCIAWEQTFLQSFDRAWVVRSLEAYDHAYKDMIENLCSALLPGIVGHVVLRKPWQAGGYTPEEYRRLASGFGEYCGKGQSRECELEVSLSRILRSLTSTIFLRNTQEDRDAAEYICGGIPDLAARIRHGIEFDCLEQVFRV